MGQGLSRRDERGASAVEFALIVLPLLVVLFGFIDFARAFNAQQAVTASAREGVRIVALGGTDAEAVSRAQSAGQPIPAGELNVAVTQGCTDGSTGDPAHVTVTHTFSFLTPLPALVPGLGQTLTLTGEGEMRCGG